MTTPMTYQQWETVSTHVDQSLALAKLLRELFWTWENEHMLGTMYRTQGLDPIDLRLMVDVLRGELTHASELVSHLEPSCTTEE